MIAALDLNLAVTAAAVLLCLIALRSMFSKEGKHPLSCGFGLAAGLVLAFMVKDHVGGFVGGLRLGIGLLLLWPAKRVLYQPMGGSAPFAVVGLILAVIIAAEPAQNLFYAFGPASAQSELRVTRNELESMQERKEQVEKRLTDLVLRRKKLRRELRGLDATDAELLENPKTALLSKIVEAKGRMESALAVINTEVFRLSVSVKELEAGAELNDLKKANPELGAILEELKREPVDLKNMDLLERTMRKDELQSILDKELR
jgi:hypothetical protein